MGSWKRGQKWRKRITVEVRGKEDVAEQVCHRRFMDRRSRAHTASTLESTVANKSESHFSWSSFVEPIAELQRLIIALIVQGGELPRIGQSNGCHLQNSRVEMIKRMVFLSTQDQMKSSHDWMFCWMVIQGCNISPTFCLLPVVQRQDSGCTTQPPFPAHGCLNIYVYMSS